MGEDPSSSSIPFKYDALPGPSHIRLLQRLDPADDGTLRFSLVTQDIDNDARKPYYCLSYTWGNPFAHGNHFREHFDAVAPQYDEANKVRVLVDEREMLIQKNLHDALSLIPQNTFAEYVNSPIDGTNGRTWLHIAAARGRVSTVQMWLTCGADINKLDDEGHNALHYAAGNGKPECIPLLIENGCRADVKDMKGATPIDVARDSGDNEAVSLLESCDKAVATDGAAKGRISPVQGTVFIWADAICINQDDVDEKSAQVTMMDRIYSDASYVIAWLGPPDEHTEVAIQTLTTLRSHLKKFEGSEIEPFSGKAKDKYAEAGVPYISRREWIALASLFQRQWFRRAWIVQEAILPRALLMYTGTTLVPWRNLGQVAEAIRHMEAKLGTHLSTGFIPRQDAAVPVNWNMAEVSKWRRFKSYATEEKDTAQEYRDFFTLRHLLSNFLTFLASDPRDKVFAYYGLLNLFASERRKVDYHMPLSSIYTIATRELIASEGNLAALSLCVYQQQRQPGLPSWVPDFGLGASNAISTNFAADKGLEYVAPKAEAPDNPELRIRAGFVGKISKVGGRSGTKPAEKLLFDRSWLTLPLSLRENGGYGENPCLSSILWTTLCMNMSAGSLFDTELYGDKAPLEQGIDFRYFVILLILAAADGKIREKLGLEITTDYDLNFYHHDYDPMKEDMEPVLADLDAFEEFDGKGNWLPTREEVLRYWNDFHCNLMRNTEMDEDGGPYDYYLPAGVTQENSRPFGNGYVMLHSKWGRKCQRFITAYSAVYGGRHLVTVNDRYLGMAGLPTRPGDEIWLAPGLHAFAVLRPIEADESGDGGGEAKDASRYEFVGTCYISGMMDGEVADLVSSRMVDVVLV
ncbi:ankyrin and HET domain-containingprotein [Purpureocillium lavendulum]|uniref:Ankyrin and HET domain-containingprotein n=1 Tax=Purpureocillium lavendulum TaxID=1247861 RepID=A0AB34FP93_9HYPO|nr:ankyrin and HET domain-containingprotein [Purpureocillium lavendulum]